MDALGLVAVERLELDPKNPRLPEDVQNASQAEILAYLFEHDVLTELADSYLTNRFFENEALLVLPSPDSTRFTVVEGNRRLAALKYLHHDADAAAARLPEHNVSPEPNPVIMAELTSVPVIQLESRQELSSYLGFRHISGLKTWSPEAKARYLYNEVNEAHREGHEEPFYVIGRRVGSNALGVRNAYYAYHALRHARDILGIRNEANFVLTERFGVWTRLLGTANVAPYIGLAPVSSDYDSVVASTDYVEADKFAQVLIDITPQPGSRRALLNDSRDATDYSSVLGNRQALEVLRQYNRLDLAAEIAQGSDFDNRLQRLLENLTSATREASEGFEDSGRSLALAKDIERQARRLVHEIQMFLPRDSDI